MLTTSGRRARLRVAALVPTLLGGVAAMAAPPLDPPRQYEVRGDGYATISGASCCGDTRFSGRFEAAYQISSAGQVALASLRVVLDDAEVDVHAGFLGLFTETIRLRCAALGAEGPAVGWMSGNELHFPTGAVRVSGFSAEERLASGACGPATLELDDASNSAPVQVVHDPVANRVELDATFSGTVEGEAEPYEIRFRSTGRFTNRPPVAGLQFETAAAPQGIACPAVFQPNLGWVAEANAPAGLVARLRSSSGDPDGPPGGPSGADLLSDRWLLSRSGGPRELIGTGYRTDPVTFEWGPTHRLELLTMDLSGATSAAQCSFRVVDTRPPVVTPPPPTTVGCSQAGGATPNTSTAVRTFVDGGSAVDLADPSPTRLTPRLGSTNITGTTFFPADGVARQVTFRFQDDWGLIGTANSSLTVIDEPPVVAVTVTPSQFPADLQWHAVQATVTATDACGGTVLLKLYKIASNSPTFDDTDISGASIGTYDLSFSLYGRLAPKGKPRIYTITYKGTDSAGNTRLATAQVTAF